MSYAARVPMTSKGPGWSPDPPAHALRAANDRGRTAPIELVIKLSPSVFTGVIMQRWLAGQPCVDPVKVFAHHGQLFALVEWDDGVHQDLVIRLDCTAWERP